MNFVIIIYTAYNVSFCVANSNLLYEYQRMRKLNVTKLKEYLMIRGKLSKESLAVETGISFFKLERMVLGKRDATKSEMLSLCSVTGLSEDQPFPLIEDGKQIA